MKSPAQDENDNEIDFTRCSIGEIFMFSCFILFFAFMLSVNYQDRNTIGPFKDPLTFSRFDHRTYNKTTNEFVFSIYNGNYYHFLNKKDKCDELITNHEIDIQNKLSIFDISMKCCIDTNDCKEINTFNDTIIVPFNMTSPDLIMIPPYSKEYMNNAICQVFLWSNHLNTDYEKCFLSLREPVMEITYNVYLY